MQTVLYFHGFESNCQTEKFARTKAFFAEHGLELVGLDVNYAEFPPPVIDQIVAEIFSRHDVVATGEFGAEMTVSLVNHGPVTFRLTA